MNKLEIFDNFFNYYLNLNTIDVIEGITSALIWGILITQLKNFINLSPIYTNILAYLLSWYSQKMIINYWKQTELFKKETEDEDFLKNEGLDIIKQYYNQHNIVNENLEKDRYHLI